MGITGIVAGLAGAKQELGETYHESSFYQALRSCGTLGTVMVSLGRTLQDKKDRGWTDLDEPHFHHLIRGYLGALDGFGLPSRLGQFS